MKASQVECPKILLDAVRGQTPVRAAIANAAGVDVMKGAQEAAAAGIIEPILFGRPDEIKRCADELSWDIADLRIVAAEDEHAAAEGAAHAAGRGEAEVVIKGHVHTDVFMRSILDRRAQLRTDRRLTHVFCMTVPNSDDVLLISDGAVNPNPDGETMKSIVRNAIDVARAIGLDRPRVALLSATEVPNPNVPSSTAFQEVSDWAAGEIAHADVYGPVAFDVAVSERAAQLKGVDHPVAGRADIIVVPEIVSGNALFKCMVHMMNACAAGLAVGAKVPILLNSRADPPAARLASAALAAIVAKSQPAR